MGISRIVSQVIQTDYLSMERKEFLKELGLGLLTTQAVIACQPTNEVKPGQANPGTPTSPGGTTSTSPGSTTTTTGSSSGSCVLTLTEEEGPFPYPGGEINNPLQRIDITGGQTGITIAYSFTIVNTSNNCAVVAGARVDIWHCNKDGYYSGYGGQNGGVNGAATSYIGQTWLRGYQVSDSNGLVKFTSIYPGWYQPRATHIHLEIFNNNVLKKQTQLAFVETISDAVHVTSLYKAHGINATRNAKDSVFGNSSTDLANETLSLSGNTSSGYTASYVIGIAL